VYLLVPALKRDVLGANYCTWADSIIEGSARELEPDRAEVWHCDTASCGGRGNLAARKTSEMSTALAGISFHTEMYSGHRIFVCMDRLIVTSPQLSRSFTAYLATNTSRIGCKASAGQGDTRPHSARLTRDERDEGLVLQFD
jgi:hypothetical protein